MRARRHSPDAPVFYVLKRFPRLSETFVLRELLGLEAAGERVVVASLLPPEQGLRHPELAALRATVHQIARKPRLRQPRNLLAHLAVGWRRPITWTRTALRARRAGTWVRFVQAGIVAREARRVGARHLHAHFVTAATEVARDAGALCGLPVTVTAHAKDIFHDENAPLVAARLDGVGAVVTVSEYNARHLRRIVPGLTVHAIGNGMPLEAPVSPTPGGPLLCVARLVPKKGIDTAIRACAVLAAKGRPLRFEIVGDGPLRSELEALAVELGVADHVRFLGACDSSGVAAAYGRCSMVVLPCRVDADGDRDGLPTVILEAMARGLPVISTDLVGIPELVDHERTGLIVGPDDPEALGVAIERFWDDPDLAARCGASARTVIASRHDPATTIALLRDAFRTAKGQR